MNIFSCIILLLICILVINKFENIYDANISILSIIISGLYTIIL
jgi:hypothetical protein